MSKNFPFNDCELLVNLVDKYKAIVENKTTNAYTNHKKNAAWGKITVEFNAVCSGLQRTSKQLRGKYKHLKHEAGKSSVGDSRVNPTPLNSKLLSMGVLTDPVPSPCDNDLAVDSSSTGAENMQLKEELEDNDTVMLEDESQPSLSVPIKSEIITGSPLQEVEAEPSITETFTFDEILRPKRNLKRKPNATVKASEVEAEPSITETFTSDEILRTKRSLKRKPNASVKASEAFVESSKERIKFAEAESKQIQKHREEEHAQLIRIREAEHRLQVEILKEKLKYYKRLNAKQIFENDLI